VTGVGIACFIGARSASRGIVLGTGVRADIPSENWLLPSSGS
jgi:hypothetical protein